MPTRLFPAPMNPISTTARAQRGLGRSRLVSASDRVFRARRARDAPATTSATVAPPTRRAARPRAREATTASPTTAAAGTAQTSLRSKRASTGCPGGQIERRKRATAASRSASSPRARPSARPSRYRPRCRPARLVRREYAPLRVVDDLVVNLRARQRRGGEPQPDLNALDRRNAHHRGGQASSPVGDRPARTSRHRAGSPVATTSKTPPSVSPRSAAASMAARMRTLACRDRDSGPGRSSIGGSAATAARRRRLLRADTSPMRTTWLMTDAADLGEQRPGHRPAGHARRRLARAGALDHVAQVRRAP